MCLANIFQNIFIKCDVRATGRKFLGRFLELPLYIGVIMARLRSVGISPVFREAFIAVGEGGIV